MVYFGLGGKYADAVTFADTCRERGLLLGAAGPKRVRMVTHIGVDETAVRKAAEIMKALGA